MWGFHSRDISDICSWARWKRDRFCSFLLYVYLSVFFVFSFLLLLRSSYFSKLCCRRRRRRLPRPEIIKFDKLCKHSINMFYFWGITKTRRAMETSSILLICQNVYEICQNVYGICQNVSLYIKTFVLGK